MSQTRLPTKLSPIFAPHSKGQRIPESSLAPESHDLSGEATTSPLPAATPSFAVEPLPGHGSQSLSTNLVSTQRSPFRPTNRSGDETPTSPLLPAEKRVRAASDSLASLPSPFRSAAVHEGSPPNARSGPTDFEAAEALAWLASGFEKQEEQDEATRDDDSSDEQAARTQPSSMVKTDSRGLAGEVPQSSSRAPAGQLTRQTSTDWSRRVLCKTAGGSEGHHPSKRRRAGGMSPMPSGDEARMPRTYSLTSRVGQAALSILEYVSRHEQSYLDNGLQGVPERVLRQEFGNNPDTSKALRCLVAENELLRRGRGGRKDPFSYTRAAGGSFWTWGSTLAPASSSPQDEKPQPPKATMTNVLAKTIQHQDRTSDKSDEEDALTRTLSQVKRRKRTSLACSEPAPAMREESTGTRSQAVSTRTETGGTSGTREAASGKSDAQPPPLPPTVSGNLNSTVSPAVLQAYVFALAAQQKELQTTAWSALPPSFLHGGVQQQSRGGQMQPVHAFARGAPEGAWEAHRRPPGVRAGSGRLINSYWREGSNAPSH